MLPLNELRGMRFPDEYVVRMFFKEQLNGNAGRVLELGCGNGNNLLLFHAFGWSVTGIDISAESLDDARHNLGSDQVEVIEADLSEGLPGLNGGFDCILLPSVIYYLPRRAFADLLDAMRPLVHSGALVYIRSRLPDDWRFGRGVEVEPGGYRLEVSETGERGLLNVFYSTSELTSMLADHGYHLEGMQCLRVHYENPQGGSVISNSDVVIWGRFAGNAGT